MKTLTLTAALLAVVACGGSPSAPSSTPAPAPTPTPSPTRIIALSGPIDFGAVQVGATATATLTVYNTGNSPLSFTGITGAPAMPDTTASPTSGTIQPGGNTAIQFFFAPKTTGAVTGTISMAADFTSGNNTTTIRGTGVAPTPASAAGTWTGRASATACRQSGPLGGTDYCHDNANISGPITMVFSQAVTGAVTGTVSFFDYKAIVSGSLNGSLLQVNGVGNVGFLDAEYAKWNTTITGNAMTGGFIFRFSAKNPGGFVEWDMVLSNVTRTAQ